jgi:peroxiredoxin
MRLFYCLILISACSLFAFGQKGKAAENFSAADMNGQTVELESLKGKVVVLTFWSTRCAICHGEIPKLNQLAASYRGKDVVFLALTTENPLKVQNYLKERRFDFDIIPNSFGVLLKYADRDRTGNINMGFPTHFLINQDGAIELKTDGFDKTALLNIQIGRLLSSGLARLE